MITGINHINISVQDIDISFKFYKEIMGFKPLLLFPYLKKISMKCQREF